MSYHGIPIIAAKLDATGTFEVAAALARQELSVALHKDYGDIELLSFILDLPLKSTAFHSMRINPPDYGMFRRIKEKAGDAIEYACVGVANG